MSGFLKLLSVTLIHSCVKTVVISEFPSSFLDRYATFNIRSWNSNECIYSLLRDKFLRLSIVILHTFYLGGNIYIFSHVQNDFKLDTDIILLNNRVIVVMSAKYVL